MISVRLDSAVPIAEQILLNIRQLIAAGRLLPGDELPTVRQLAADLGINLNTVARGYRELENAGLVSTVRGRGTQVTASAEIARGSLKDVRARVAAGMREGLTNAKLAGMERDEVERTLSRLMDEFWPENPARKE
jgi:GntR family transcriptional regulator